MKTLFYFLSTLFATWLNAAATMLPLPSGAAMVYEYEGDELTAINYLESDGYVCHVDMDNTFWDRMAYSAVQSINFLRNDLSFEKYIQPQTDYLAKTIFGQIALQMMGYWKHAPASGVFGNGEVAGNVRVTFINGILNTRVDLQRTVELLSVAHGGVNVHYVFHPTKGWTKDLIDSFWIKIGCVSHYARLLADTWRALILDMGGVGCGGVIVHYAHSIGASDTLTAMSLMTPEELQMIHVVTLGSPTILKDEGFAEVENYASVRDGVSIIGLVCSLFEKNSHVEFIGTWAGLPIVEHPLDREAYKELLELLGLKFQEQYGTIELENPNG